MAYWIHISPQNCLILQVFHHPNSHFNIVICLDFRNFLYEYVSDNVSSETIDWKSCVDIFHKLFYIIPKEFYQELSSLLVDVIWIVDIQVSDAEDNRRGQLALLLFNLLEKQLLDLVLVKERLDAELLEKAKIIPSASLFNKKQIRINTTLLYKQQKFNLLREETEGFAKLIVLLGSFPVDGPTESFFDQCLSLIGYFDLDPIRVLDVIMDEFTFAVDTKSHQFIQLLKLFEFSSKTLNNIAAFKLKFVAAEYDRDAYEGLMMVVALLIKEGMLSVEDIYHALAPLDKDCNELLMARSKSILSASRQSMMTLASSGDPVIPTTLTYQDIDGRLLDFDATKNQKVTLLACLLENDDVENAKWIVSRLQVAVRLSSRVLKAIDYHLQSLIKACFNSTEYFSQPIIGELDYWLPLLGHGLYLDTMLLIKFCRILSRSPENAYTAKILLNHVFPALSLNLANPALCHEVWNVLERLPYSHRYSLYYRWRNEVYTNCGPELAFCKTITISDTRKVMRRLSKENYKQLGRLLGKLSHANPTVVFPVVLDQLQAYENLITPVVDSLRYLTPLSFDVLICTM